MKKKKKKNLKGARTKSKKTTKTRKFPRNRGEKDNIKRPKKKKRGRKCVNFWTNIPRTKPQTHH